MNFMVPAASEVTPSVVLMVPFSVFRLAAALRMTVLACLGV